MTLGGGDEVEGPQEEVLRCRGAISVGDVIRLRSLTENYLVDNRTNPYGVHFTRFLLRNPITGEELLHLTGEAEDDPHISVRYVFPPQFLSIERLAASITYRLENTSSPINSFTMLERHFFDGQGLTSFKFNLGECRPGEERTVENLYELPALGIQLKRAIVEHPFLTQSDCFFFINGFLVLHFKAQYSFAGNDVNIFDFPIPVS